MGPGDGDEHLPPAPPHVPLGDQHFGGSDSQLARRTTAVGKSVTAANESLGKSWRRISLRQILVVLVLFGNVGLIAELLLLGHTESFNQWIPLILLMLGTISTVVVMFRPGYRAIRVFQWIMVSFLMAGILGLYLHYRGNVEFALERYPDAGGLNLMWKALRGATPTLAPGALAQLGLLGLVYTFKHPLLSDRAIGGTEA